MLGDQGHTGPVAWAAAMADRYQNFEALAANEKCGVDYHVCQRNRATPIIIIAPHGGCIEPGSSQIAKEIAGETYSLYCFEGLRSRPHGDLHITSCGFDEPEALELVTAARTVVAVHGRADNGDSKTVWMGGRDTALRDAIASSLVARGFPASSDQRLSGREPKNICNRGTTGAGVQLEIPRTLRDRLVCDRAELHLFGRTVREALANS
jgi:phage replication-related protein YjqB (UPF0714/DUF867 family)